MKLLLASIAPRAGTGPAQALLEQYSARLAAYLPVEAQLYRTEAAFFDALARLRARTPPVLVLLDSRGKALSSEALAAWLGAQQDSGRQLLVFAIGPADGWSDAARAQLGTSSGTHPGSQAREHSGLLLSFGPMTLPHELARVLLAEQLYRAFTILAGHPYHSGHTTP